MNLLPRDFLNHRGVSKTTYRGTWNRSNVWLTRAFVAMVSAELRMERISDRG